MRSNLRQARKDAGLTQIQLAKAVGVTGAYISQIELGQRTPPVDLAIAISRVVKQPVERLFSALELGETLTENRLAG